MTEEFNVSCQSSLETKRLLLLRLFFSVNCGEMPVWEVQSRCVSSG